MRQRSSTNAPTPHSSKKSPAIPKTGTNSDPATQVKSLFRNILLASPDFPRLYEQVLLSEGRNPNQSRILAERYPKNEGGDMPVQPSDKACTHIKVTGVRCGSPALRGEQFCYFHQRMLRMRIEIPTLAARGAARMGHPDRTSIKVKGSGQKCPLHMSTGTKGFQFPKYSISQLLNR